MRCCRQPPCGREQQRPGRRRAVALFPVDPSGGDGQGCARLGAGGTPALPGSLHPMTSSHQGHKVAEAFSCRLWLKEVHLSSGLFVFIGVHWWFVFNNDQAVFPRMIRTAGQGCRKPVRKSDWVIRFKWAGGSDCGSGPDQLQPFHEEEFHPADQQGDAAHDGVTEGGAEGDHEDPDPSLGHLA